TAPVFSATPPEPVPTPAPPAARAPAPWPVVPSSSPGFAPADAGTGAGAVDESLEIWLVQKNKLDFGPFSMAEVKRQIQKGEIEGEHVLVDSDSGRRWRVADHPHLARF